MDNQTQTFLRAMGPSLKQIASETGISYGYLRLIASGTQEPGPDVRRKLVEWGEQTLPRARAALTALRRTLPAD